MKIKSLISILALASPSTWAQINAGVNTYDLTNNWVNGPNPNGAWSYLQGSTVLPYQSSLSALTAPAPQTTGVGGGYAPANATGHVIPAMFKATASGQFPSSPIDYSAGDIVVHSVDNGAGNPSAGEAVITWTSPADGQVTYSGAVWYAMSAYQRSNDFTFKNLSSNTTLAAGTVSFSNGFTRANPKAFSSSAPIAVKAGDVLALTISRTPGQQPGSLTGVRLTITEGTPVTAILPQLAFGGGWYSALYFTNTTNTPESFTVNFFGDDGTPLAIPGQGGSSATVALPARGTARIEALNAGPLVQGYVSAALPLGVTGYGVFRQSVPGVNDQEAVVPLSGSTATTNTMVFDDTAFTTAVAIVNLSSAANTITVVAYDKQGNAIGTGSITLAANAKTAVVLRDIAGLSGVRGNAGSVDFTASIGSLAVLGLRFNGSAFTSIPTSAR